MLSIYLFKFKKIKTTDKSTHGKSMKYEQTATKENDLK